MIRFLKEPLVQFLLIGACIYVVYAFLGVRDEAAAERSVFITEEQIGNLAATWEKRWNRPPTDAELIGLVRSYLREDVMYREALAMGLDDGDHIIRRRLAQKLEFLTNDIVRLQEPSVAELQAYFSRNLEAFTAPDQVTFVQVFFNPDVRGEAAEADAVAARERLQAGGEPDPDTLLEGDRSMLRTYFAGVTEQDIRRDMGTDFATRVMHLAPGEWHGPLLSGYGTHLVYVYDYERAPPPVLDDMRDKVLAEWQREQLEKFNADFLNGLIDQYEVVIEAPAPFVESVLQPESPTRPVVIPDGIPAA
jgi:hypothetical protein